MYCKEWNRNKFVSWLLLLDRLSSLHPASQLDKNQFAQYPPTTNQVDRETQMQCYDGYEWPSGLRVMGWRSGLVGAIFQKNGCSLKSVSRGALGEMAPQPPSSFSGSPALGINE